MNEQRGHFEPPRVRPEEPTMTAAPEGVAARLDELDVAAWLEDAQFGHADEGECPMCQGQDAPCDVLRLIAAVRAVEARHEPDRADTPFCVECGHCWPCWTVRDVTSALSGRDDHAEEAGR